MISIMATMSMNCKNLNKKKLTKIKNSLEIECHKNPLYIKMKNHYEVLLLSFPVLKFNGLFCFA